MKRLFITLLLLVLASCFKEDPCGCVKYTINARTQMTDIEYIGCEYYPLSMGRDENLNWFWIECPE